MPRQSVAVDRTPVAAEIERLMVLLVSRIGGPSLGLKGLPWVVRWLLG
jgi:hypothetical protein